MKFWNVSSRVFEENTGENQGGAGAAAESGAFDPKAFQASLMAEFNKTLNGAIKGLKKDFDKELAPLRKTPEQIAAEAAANENQQAEGQHVEGVKVTPEELQRRREHEALKKQVTDLQKAGEEKERRAQEAERQRAIESATSDFAFRDGKYKQTFLKAIGPDIIRDEDGELVAQLNGEVVSYKDYIKAQAEEMPHFFAPRGDGGAGASAGRTAGSKVIDVNSIGPGSSPAEKEAYRAQIAEVLRSGGH